MTRNDRSALVERTAADSKVNGVKKGPNDGTVWT